MAFFKAGSRTFHYSDRTIGTGPTLVLANSLGTDFRIWDPLLPKLEGIGRIVRYDKRGHGLTDVSEPPYSIQDLSSDLKAIVDHVGLDHFLLGGVSIGGMIAQDYAARYPKQVDGLVCMDTAPKIGEAALWQDRIDAITTNGLESIADGPVRRGRRRNAACTRQGHGRCHEKRVLRRSSQRGPHPKP